MICRLKMVSDEAIFRELVKEGETERKRFLSLFS